MKDKETVVPVDLFYRGRSEYSIIGLTGIAGSGCSSLAELISNRELLFKAARNPEQLYVNYPPEKNSEKQKALKIDDVNDSINSFVLKKKYEICYNFLQENYQEYDIVKYTKLLWLYVLLYAKHINTKLTGEILSSYVEHVLIDKYRPSKDHDEALKKEIDYKQEKRNTDIHSIVSRYKDWSKLANCISRLSVDWVDKEFKSSEKREWKKELSELFFKDTVFLYFVKYFTNALGDFDYYSSCFFYHRLATLIRSTGNPSESYDEWFESGDKNRCDHLYLIIRLFVILLDGRRENKEHRRIVIDSIRNSAEALYLHERYSGFYLIAVHDENSTDHLKTKVELQYKKSIFQKSTDLFSKCLQKLNKVESEQDDFERGVFSAPDTNRVIERSEIHIQNLWGDPDAKKEVSLRHMAEQWIRYAALILHPGLVTPTTSERCMAVAYTAKLNSGCLSRQVGAAITNEDGSVRSIGWNEVPHGQVSCSLRTIDGIEHNDLCAKCSYSEFEKTGSEKYKDGKSFVDKIKDDFGSNLNTTLIRLHGLPFSYCFKALHNRYEGEKNQVFTRSLHAEENAILQMSKYGGEALKNGVIYVTASPCELCSKKLYQIGVRQIVYIDPYPGIARQHIIAAGFKQPDLKIFEGAIGVTYFKLYQPFMPYKDELNILTEGKHTLNPPKVLLEKILEKLDIKAKTTYSDKEIEEILREVPKKTSRNKKVNNK